MHLCPPAGVAKISINDRSLVQLRLYYDMNKYGDDTFVISGLNPILFALHIFV